MYRPGLDVEPVVGDQRHLVESGHPDQAEAVAVPPPATGDGRTAGAPRQGHVARARRLDSVDEVNVLHDRMVRPESTEGSEEAPPQKQDLVGRHQHFNYKYNADL